MGGLAIRDAREDELAKVADILAVAYGQYFPPPDAPLTPEERKAWEGYLDDIRDVRSRFGVSELILAEEDGRLLGAVTFYPPHAGARYPTEAEHRDWPAEWAAFRLLGVHPDARGKGVGRALTEECLRRARAQGAPAVGLHTTALMEVARAMYRRMGWVRAPEYDFYPMPDFCVEAYRLAL